MVTIPSTSKTPRGASFTTQVERTDRGEELGTEDLAEHSHWRKTRYRAIQARFFAEKPKLGCLMKQVEEIEEMFKTGTEGWRQDTSTNICKQMRFLVETRFHPQTAPEFLNAPKRKEGHPH